MSGGAFATGAEFDPNTSQEPDSYHLVFDIVGVLVYAWLRIDYGFDAVLCASDAGNDLRVSGMERRRSHPHEMRALDQEFSIALWPNRMDIRTRNVTHH